MTRGGRLYVAALCGIVAVLAGAGAMTAGRRPTAAAQARGSVDVPWAMYGLDTAETHYSPLKQIDTTNVARLGLAWAADLDAFPGQIQGTPLVVDGTIYATGPWSVVVAVDARTGRVKWRWDPQIPHQVWKTDARGVRTRSRWYYHVHPPGERDPDEHGHFHLFLHRTQLDDPAGFLAAPRYS